MEMEVKNKRVYKTPKTPRFKIVCPENDEDIIEPNLQSRYCSGVGMLVHLIKYSQPDFETLLGSFQSVWTRKPLGLTLKC
jgi:hypothetical protein